MTDIKIVIFYFTPFIKSYWRIQIRHQDLKPVPAADHKKARLSKEKTLHSEASEL